jgi:hypothetical protein
MNWSHSLKPLLQVLLSLCIILSACADPNRELTGERRDSAISATLKWGRLAPFPTSAQNVVVKTEGNMFTRSFEVHFQAPAQDIDRWIKESPGLAESTPLFENGSRKYFIKPAGGANRAEVRISNNQDVLVYVSWS